LRGSLKRNSRYFNTSFIKLLGYFPKFERVTNQKIMTATLTYTLLLAAILIGRKAINLIEQDSKSS